MPAWTLRERPSPESVDRPAAILKSPFDKPSAAAPAVPEEPLVHAAVPAEEGLRGTPDLNEYVVVMKRRTGNPTWTKPYQDRLRKANLVAAEQTQHLKGTERVLRMNDVVRQ